MSEKRRIHVKGRRGVTLVELLIVIVIIGILASGMMLSSGAATATATATTIVGDLRVLAGASVMYYADSMDAGVNADGIGKLYKFLGDSNKIKKESVNYKFVINTEGWWVGYTSGRMIDTAVQAKIGARAKEVGLYPASAAGTAGTVVYTTGQTVYMKAR